MDNYQVIDRPERDQLGEGPCWCARRGALLWVDIMGQALHSLHLATGRLDRWSMPERIGWIIERGGRDDFMIGLKSGFATLALDPFKISAVGNPEPDRPHNRLNDAKTDPAGRIWAGSKDDRDQEASGALYRLDPGLRWSRHDDGYQVTNGPTFSADGRTLYHTDSAARTVYAFDLEASGELRDKRVFLRFEDAWGYPDGMTTDCEGGLWIAHWGGSRISRFTPDGRLERAIRLPASQVTSCAFAGPGLDRMFVTSAASGTQGEALAGALFEVDPGVRGLPPTPFAG